MCTAWPQYPCLHLTKEKGISNTRHCLLCNWHSMAGTVWLQWLPVWDKPKIVARQKWVPDCFMGKVFVCLSYVLPTVSPLLKESFLWLLRSKADLVLLIKWHISFKIYICKAFFIFINHLIFQILFAHCYMFLHVSNTHSYSLQLPRRGNPCHIGKIFWHMHLHPLYSSPPTPLLKGTWFNISDRILIGKHHCRV